MAIPAPKKAAYHSTRDASVSPLQANTILREVGVATTEYRLMLDNVR
jgi:hypothetical protein